MACDIVYAAAAAKQIFRRGSLVSSFHWSLYLVGLTFVLHSVGVSANFKVIENSLGYDVVEPSLLIKRIRSRPEEKEFTEGEIGFLEGVVEKFASRREKESNTGNGKVQVHDALREEIRKNLISKIENVSETKKRFSITEKAKKFHVADTEREFHEEHQHGTEKGFSITEKAVADASSNKNTDKDEKAQAADAFYNEPCNTKQKYDETIHKDGKKVAEALSNKNTDKDEIHKDCKTINEDCKKVADALTNKNTDKDEKAQAADAFYNEPCNTKQKYDESIEKGRKLLHKDRKTIHKDCKKINKNETNAKRGFSVHEEHQRETKQGSGFSEDKHEDGEYAYDPEEGLVIYRDEYQNDAVEGLEFSEDEHAEEEYQHESEQGSGFSEDEHEDGEYEYDPEEGLVIYRDEYQNDAVEGLRFSEDEHAEGEYEHESEQGSGFSEDEHEDGEYEYDPEEGLIIYRDEYQNEAVEGLRFSEDEHAEGEYEHESEKGSGFSEDEHEDGEYEYDPKEGLIIYRDEYQNEAVEGSEFYENEYQSDGDERSSVDENLQHAAASHKKKKRRKIFLLIASAVCHALECFGIIGCALLL